MSKNSEKVIAWRRRTKQRMVDAMGGCCAACQYSSCNEALEFHHLDPSQKDFSFGKIRSHPAAWHKVVEELRKCVLLCANCHREVHAGKRRLPNVLPVFDESLTAENIYRPRLASEVSDPHLKVRRMKCCSICSSIYYGQGRTCSIECHKKKISPIDWSAIDLFTMKKTMSNLAIAAFLGISETSVRKRLKKLVDES